jgi:ComEC/Rec2-related protein
MLLPAPGDRISVSALLNPPPPPSAPGAYDFARDAYFRGVGGVGLALGEPVQLQRREADLPSGLRLQIGVNAFRWSLTRRLVDQLGPDRGGLAAAMTTGHEAFVPPAQVEALRAAGLAHIISISGLHMAIVGGFVFALVRLTVALAPALALRLSGRKLAAAAGGVAVLGYLVLSGAPDPAVRSAVTAFAAFAAILADRRAISLRTLALAATLLLLIRPEAVTQPGFQMSFAATAALVALVTPGTELPAVVATLRPDVILPQPAADADVLAALDVARIAVAARTATVAPSPVLGGHPSIRCVLDVVDRIATTPATVLVTGESGTGKSLLARLIHDRSRRSGRFVEVACGSLSETLLESELFGHVAGAFTGATSDRSGRFLQADGGTLFLDEIATASPALQVKLLRVLQQMQFEPVGSSHTHTVDARIVLSTNDDLARLVAAGRFRDLTTDGFL